MYGAISTSKEGVQSTIFVFIGLSGADADQQISPKWESVQNSAADVRSPVRKTSRIEKGLPDSKQNFEKNQSALVISFA
jgi:hypothetical protein